MSDKILEIKDCEIQYITEIGIVHAVNHIDFSIERGASMGWSEKLELEKPLLV